MERLKKKGEEWEEALADKGDTTRAVAMASQPSLLRRQDTLHAEAVDYHDPGQVLRCRQRQPMVVSSIVINNQAGTSGGEKGSVSEQGTGHGETPARVITIRSAGQQRL